MKKQSSGEQKSRKLTLLDLKETLFHTGERRVNLEDATDEEFDQFIRHHVTIGWSLEERRDAVNLALEQGKTLEIREAKTQEKTQYTLIFKGIESPPEADAIP